jgi:hypothetical protein
VFPRVTLSAGAAAATPAASALRDFRSCRAKALKLLPDRNKWNFGAM